MGDLYIEDLRLGRARKLNSTDMSSTARTAVPVVKSDSTVFNPPAQALYVGTAGDVVVVPETGDTPVTFKSVPAGTTLQIQVKQVMAATTAADILALGY